MVKISVLAGVGVTEGADEEIAAAEEYGRGDRLVSYCTRCTRVDVLEARGELDEARHLALANIEFSVEVFGPAHVFTTELENDLREFDQRHRAVHPPD